MSLERAARASSAQSPGRPSGFPEPIALSPREAEVLRLTSQGQDDRQMAHTLGISVGTLCTYVKSLHRKLGVSHRTAMLSEAHRLGIL